MQIRFHTTPVLILSQTQFFEKATSDPAFGTCALSNILNSEIDTNSTKCQLEQTHPLFGQYDTHYDTSVQWTLDIKKSTGMGFNFVITKVSLHTRSS